MSASMNIHRIESITITRENSDGTEWTTYAFKDEDGFVFEVIAFPAGDGLDSIEITDDSHE